MTRGLVAIISTRGERRWSGGHPWIFKSDVVHFPSVPAGSAPAGIVRVENQRGNPLGLALWSPKSEISLRFLTRDAEATIDGHWWRSTLERAIARRSGLIGQDTNACRLVHAEGDGIPSLVVDRYDQWLVVQFQSAGLEHFRVEIVDALKSITGCAGILARNDASVRTREGLEREVVTLYGEIPEEIEVLEHGVRYIAAPHTGQKTGAFLDQRDARRRVGQVARGRCLDVFSYHGSFALHMARLGTSVIAVDASGAALERAQSNAGLNGLSNITTVEADAFEFLREQERTGAQFETVVLDPPAFAKNRGSIAGAIRGYKEINLRGMKIIAPGGLLYTASCSYHLSRADFLEMLKDAASQSGRRVVIRELTAQALDHPEVITIPETGYLKGALLEVH